MTECVQTSTQSVESARVARSPMEAKADTRERVSVTLLIEADVCAVAFLEKCLTQPGPVLWLRHWLGEAIRYVVGLATGYKFNYIVLSGVVSKGAE